MRTRTAILCFSAVAGVAAVLSVLHFFPERVAGQSGPETISVRAGDDLQRALDRARPGDTLVLEAGAVFRGNFVMRRKDGDGTITVTAESLADYPAGRRVDIQRADRLPKLHSPNAMPALRNEAGAHDWTIRGIEFAAPGIYTQVLVALGSSRAQDAGESGYNFEFDRCYFRGDPRLGGKRGMEMNAASVVVKNSVFREFFATGQDTQAIATWNGPGPFYIWNNYLESSGYPVIFGGAAAVAEHMNPSNIQVYGNHFTRPVEWRDRRYTVKNLFELKNAHNVDVRFNLFENNWMSGQNGFAILFTVRTCEAGNTPFHAVENVRFANNIVRNSEGGGVNIMGRDDVRQACATAGTGEVSSSGRTVRGVGTQFTQFPPLSFLQVGNQARVITRVIDDTTLEVSRDFTPPIQDPASFRWYTMAGRTNNIVVRENLFEQIGWANGQGTGFQLLAGASNVTIANNTVFARRGTIMMESLFEPMPGLVFRDNITQFGQFGVAGTGTGPGNPTFRTFTPDAVVTGNVFFGAPDVAAATRAFPAENSFVRSSDDVGFADLAARDYRLTPQSPFFGRSASGRDPGADIPLLNQVERAAREGNDLEGVLFFARQGRPLKQQGGALARR